MERSHLNLEVGPSYHGVKDVVWFEVVLTFC